MLQYEAILLNHKPFADMTNLNADTLTDPWDFEGIPRDNFKKYMTRALYGSSKSPEEIWTNLKLPFTKEQVKTIANELEHGKLAVADKFKEFIIKNVKPKPTMQIKIMDEEFTTECNRWRHVGDRFVDYCLYDTDSKELRTITHTHTHKEPDLDRFRRYFVTLLIHNLDSQVANYVCDTIYDRCQWIIDIHDAFIVSPMQAANTRKAYAKKMNEIYRRREETLTSYFESIGIDKSATYEWLELLKVVEPMTDFSCSGMALK